MNPTFLGGISLCSMMFKIADLTDHQPCVSAKQGISQEAEWDDLTQTI